MIKIRRLYIVGYKRTFGVESNGLDMNVFNGDEFNLYRYANSLGIARKPLVQTKIARSEAANDNPQTLLEED